MPGVVAGVHTGTQITYYFLSCMLLSIFLVSYLAEKCKMIMLSVPVELHDKKIKRFSTFCILFRSITDKLGCRTHVHNFRSFRTYMYTT